MKSAYRGSAILLLACLNLAGANFGKTVVIGGHASDIALDDRRSVLYIANFGGRRIDVMSTSDHTLQTPIRLDSEPSSVALSASGRYLVATHFDALGGSTNPARLTILDLDGNGRTVIPIPLGVAAANAPAPVSVPLAIEFGASNIGLLVTTHGIYQVDPEQASLRRLQAPPLECGKAPATFGTFPPQLIRASSAVSGNGRIIIVAAEEPPPAGTGTGGGIGGIIGGGGGTTEGPCGAAAASGGKLTNVIRYDVVTGAMAARVTTTSPTLGPRVVSTDLVGANVLVGWTLVNANDRLIAQFPYAQGAFNVGSHAYDFKRDVIYTHMPSALGAPTPGSTEPPVLHLVDTDNLTVRERLSLAENLAGRSLFSRDMNTVYAISDSGITILPVGSLDRTPRVTAAEEQLVFRATNCENGLITQTLNVIDLGGNRVDFSLSLPANTRGFRFSQVSGTTPARIQISVDPSAYRTQTGTTAIPLTIESNASVAVTAQVMLLVNTKEPDQRGEIRNLPGKIVDVLADPERPRVYAIRQDRNQVLVLNSRTFATIATLRTGNTPTQMALTRDNRYLIVGNNNSQIANVYDLETLEQDRPIVFLGGHYPRSIAVSNSAMLAISRNAGEFDCPDKSKLSPPAMIDRIDFANRIATTSCTLGVYINSLPLDSIMIGSPAGGSIFTAMEDGTVLLYNDAFDAFEVSRKDTTALSGAYGAFSEDLFLAGTTLFNRSMVRVGTVPNATAASTIMGTGDTILTASAGTAGSAGVLQRFQLSRSDVRPVRTIEAPTNTTILKTQPVGQIGQTILAFQRGMAVTDDGGLVYLSISGLTALAAGYDRPVPNPVVRSVANTADGGGIATGGLITISGTDLSTGTRSADGAPLPTGLAETCATVNNLPIPLVRVSPSRIDAQMPFEVVGTANLVVTTPSGRTTPFSLNVPATSLAVFRNGQAGDFVGLPEIYRSANSQLTNVSNPVHPGDTLSIIATGLGRTTPQVNSGAAAGSDPLASTLARPSVTLGNVALEIVSSALVPGQVGVYQINALVPTTMPAGTEVPLVLEMGSSKTTFNVRVVNP